MTSSGMHNLTTLIKRLEAATLRLEDIATSSTLSLDANQADGEGGSKPASINGEAAPSRSPTAPLAQVEQVPEALSAFDALISDELAAFATVSGSLGGLIAEQSNTFGDAFKAQRGVILVATKAKEPSQTEPVYMEVLKELVQGIQDVNEIRDKNRKVPQENHLSMLADGVGILSWVTMKPSPDKYVAEVLGGAQLYGNKILKEFKEKETEDVDWVKAFVKLCGALVQYIKQHHPKGLEWNASGVTAEVALQQVKDKATATDTPSPSSTTRSAAPGPPPPPPLPNFGGAPPAPPMPPAAASAAGGDMGAVFQELNRGEAVTSGLRKVDKSEMTHKNPSLRAQGPVPQRSDSSSSLNGRGKSPAPPTKKQKPESMRAKKPSRKELDGNKWTVENYESEQTPVEIEAERQQSILISRCKSATIRVNGKANAISIDNCSKLDLLVDSLVSSIDVINTSNFRMQVLGSLPSIQLDKVDVGTVYLSAESLSAEVFTSKCTSINITLPPAKSEEDSIECPVPEQIKSTIVDGKLVSEIVKQEG